MNPALFRTTYYAVSNDCPSSVINGGVNQQTIGTSDTTTANIDPAINWDLMSNAVKINLFRILQESLQNCNKYANATTIQVEFKQVKSRLSLKISDDGDGFNVKKGRKGNNNLFSKIVL